jgi:hypothetical protein
MSGGEASFRDVDVAAGQGEERFIQGQEDNLVAYYEAMKTV